MLVRERAAAAVGRFGHLRQQRAEVREVRRGSIGGLMGSEVGGLIWG